MKAKTDNPMSHGFPMPGMVEVGKAPEGKRANLADQLRQHELWLIGLGPDQGGHQANLEQMDLRQATLLMANLKNASMKNCLLHQAEMQHSDLRGTDLSDAVMTGADLTGVQINWANFSRALMQKAQLLLAKGMYADFSDARLDGANLSHIQVSNGQFHRACLDGASLLQAELPNAVFREADLRRADLRDASLRYADLRGAVLDGAILAGVAGDGVRIKSIDVLGPPIVYTDTHLCIGRGSPEDFKSMPLDEWWAMSPQAVEALGIEGVNAQWWANWGPVIEKIIGEQPAQSLEESLEDLEQAGFEVMTRLTKAAAAGTVSASAVIAAGPDPFDDQVEPYRDTDEPPAFDPSDFPDDPDSGPGGDADPTDYRPEFDL